VVRECNEEGVVHNPLVLARVRGINFAAALLEYGAREVLDV
jgi:hypothetical protein